jgi:hypothetical protein
VEYGEEVENNAAVASYRQLQDDDFSASADRDDTIDASGNYSSEGDSERRSVVFNQDEGSLGYKVDVNDESEDNDTHQPAMLTNDNLVSNHL